MKISTMNFKQGTSLQRNESLRKCETEIYIDLSIKLFVSTTNMQYTDRYF